MFAFRRALFFLVVCSMLVSRPAAAQREPAAKVGTPQDGLSFFNNYFVTGDAAVYGVGVKGTGVRGFADSSIAIPRNGLPPNATPVAAFLYWASVVAKP